VTITQSRAMFAGVIVVVLAAIGCAESQVNAQLSPAELVKAVIRTELHPPNVSEIRWEYLLNKEIEGRQETREVVETKFGSLDRLIMTAGRPLPDPLQRDEADRILRLSHNPEEQRKLEQTHNKDVAQCNAFLQMIPDAFVFEYAGQSGGLIKLVFKPNPYFRPISREGKVLHETAGEIWVDANQQRLVSIRGQLTNEVKFGGGLLGRLERGGEFNVKRTEVVPGHWELTEIVVNMRGKALLFKSISVQQKEVHSNFQPVPDDLSLPDAAGLLLQQVVIATKR
jgi:hypothetical protein